jgi:Spy/CpxP family protein refolding chaperone
MRRWTLLGLVAVGVTALSVGATVLTGAWAQGPGGPRMHGPGMPGEMMKRMVSAALDEALDQANVTQEQRSAIQASRDRALATIDAQRPDRRAHREQMLALFATDHLDAGQLQALHAPMEQRHQAVQAAIAQAIVEIHDTLTPAQRQVLVEYARTHGPGRMH